MQSHYKACIAANGKLVIIITVFLINFQLQIQFYCISLLSSSIGHTFVIACDHIRSSAFFTQLLPDIRSFSNRIKVIYTREIIVCVMSIKIILMWRSVYLLRGFGMNTLLRHRDIESGNNFYFKLYFRALTSVGRHARHIKQLMPVVPHNNRV